MKVLIVASLFAPWRLGGAEVVAESTARALADLGHEVCVLTLSPDQVTSQEQCSGYQVRRTPLLNIYSLQEMGRATILQRIRWHMKDRWNNAMHDAFSNELALLKPDIALLHNIAGFSISIYQALSSRSVPFVQVLHDHYFCCLYSTMYQSGRSCEHQCLRCKLVRRTHSETTQFASGVIGVSSFILERIRSQGLFSDMPCKVIHNLATIPAVIDSLNNSFADNSGSRYTFGYLGILNESKGVIDLIDAFKISAGPLDRLKLAGFLENESRKIRMAINSDPRIEYLGVVDRELFFSSIDCLVVPSRVPEAFGLVAQEAWFRGVPVIVSNQGALPEAIGSAPATYIYDVHDSDGLSTALQNLLADRNRWQRYPAISALNYQSMKRSWAESYEAFLQRFAFRN